VTADQNDRFALKLIRRVPETFVGCRNSFDVITPL
jgi:hypothetical protein